jgi:molybdate/tungstate transport system ATP-binding protein
VIRVTNLTVRVPGFLLDQATFDVSAGGVGIVTGSTGAGKTTLVEAIAGVRPAVNGHVFLRDTDVTNHPPEHRDVGLVYQHAWLFPHLSVHANVSYGARRVATVDTLIHRLHITPLLARPVSTLSGGERQLVALARALAREPHTLLLDEPFAAMDIALRDETRAMVLNWAAERGVTTLLVTHDAAEAALNGSVQLRVEGGVVRTLG